MKWIKQGLIFKPDGKHEWNKSHAQVPFCFLLDNDTLRIFYATRDIHNRTSTSFIDVNPKDPKQILYVHDKPVLEHGEGGSYDDSGAMPSWIVKDDDRLLLYYTGWNRSEEASYRLSIGVAASNDNGVAFQKLYPGPILDRSKFDPIWVGQPCVIKENDSWKMWYLSCEKIEIINGHPEPFYNVKYAYSENGMDWIRNNDVCIDFEPGKIDAIGRPCVFKENDTYKMFHSNRKAVGYRSDKAAGYRIGYSESKDGIHWKRLDDIVGIEKSEEGWDSIMNEYCTTYKFEGKRYLIYNGDGFGASGFGYAVLESTEV